MKRVCVTGSSGFIGTHLVRRLKAEGYWVRGVDVKLPEFAPFAGDDLLLSDLRDPDPAQVALADVDAVYHLACEMGGIGFTLPHSFDQRLTNSRIDQNVAAAVREQRVERVFFASSACVYNETLQAEVTAWPLTEEDAYPAQPDLSYGWTKLMGEQLLQDLAHDTQVGIRIFRFHNVYGELGAWDGGREKAPAALCRKVALAKLRGDDHITIWGDGEQQRSFMYVDDCVEGIRRLMDSTYAHPLNLGRDDAVSINTLARLIMDVAGYECAIEHDLSQPQGVRARNSDNSRLREVLGWTPQIDLRAGLERTYPWIEQRVTEKYGEQTHV